MEDKPAENVDAEEWIAKKGISAKGKKCADRGEVKSVRFIEPLVKEEDTVPAEEQEAFNLDIEAEDIPDSQLDDELEDIIEEPTLF